MTTYSLARVELLSAAEICDALAAEHDVYLDVCRRDTLEFPQTASTLGIIHVQSVPAP